MPMLLLVSAFDLFSVPIGAVRRHPLRVWLYHAAKRGTVCCNPRRQIDRFAVKAIIGGEPDEMQDPKRLLASQATSRYHPIDRGRL